MNYSRLVKKKNPHEVVSGKDSLIKNLGVVDLTSLGIAAVIGAGIFSTIGRASFVGGPAVVFLFLFTALACLCSALCYAHFASFVRGAGSAYSYAYVSFGELIAWIIGWDLLMEYAIGNIAVAISWSDYFTGFFRSMNIIIPEYLTIDYLSAQRFYQEFQTLGINASIPFPVREGYLAWLNAPTLAGFKFILDLPALVITILITGLVYLGIKESKTTGNILVLIKIGVVLMVITVGAFYISTENWHPFAPNGISGIVKGTASVFFAYIGFDAISTTTEECKNPQRDLPKAMIFALLICTVLYVLISLVLTGMVNYSELNVGDPLAYVFEKHELTLLSELIALSAIVAMTGVLLVFQLGQPRILMSMSRDGLLPKKFAKIHPRFRTPSFSTIITGFMVSVPILFLNHATVTDLCAIGTLFAFALVCAGALLDKSNNAKFKIPFYSSRYSLPILFIVILGLLVNENTEESKRFFLSPGIEDIPHFLFIGFAIWISFFGFLRTISLIPAVGLACNLFLITELGMSNWLRFGSWLAIGIVVYFLYGYRRKEE